MNDSKDKKIAERTFAFALMIIELYKYLVSKNEYVLSKQALKSGTSIGEAPRPRLEVQVFIAGRVKEHDRLVYPKQGC